MLQLLEEGRLRLDSTLDEHLPGLGARGEKITIRQLLNHRSGLVNFTDYTSWLEQASRSPSTRPINIVRFAVSHPAAFRPGIEWQYSNTNYIALGLVIEKITGHPYGQEFKQRVLEPLDLESTELPVTRRLQDLDDEGENPHVPWAAGAIVSNAQDIARFLSALLSGRILSEESLTAMKQTVVVDPALADGLGLFSTQLHADGFGGHQGAILDSATIVNASEDGSSVVVISAHGGTPSGPPPARVRCCATRRIRVERRHHLSSTDQQART